MKARFLLAAVLGVSLSGPVLAVDSGAVVGGAIGGGAGAAVGSAIGGRDGAIIGGAIGGATGAAIGSSPTKTEKVVVRETVVIREIDGGPPGHRKGKKKGWKK